MMSLVSSMQCTCAIRHAWPVRFYNIFQHCFINGMIFEKEKLLNIKCVFWYSLQRFSEIVLILRIGRHMIIIVTGLVVSIPYYCHFLMKLEFNRQIFWKCPNIKFYENPSSENQRAAGGWAGGRTWRVVAFRNFANAPNTLIRTTITWKGWLCGIRGYRTFLLARFLTTPRYLNCHS
jgi:hypothetical protein